MRPTPSQWLRITPAMLFGLALPQLGVAQVPERIVVPGAVLPRQAIRNRDLRPAGPAPDMIYGRALSPTRARVTWSTVPDANGYQLYRSGAGSGASTLIHSVVATPGLVLAVNPTAYQGPPPPQPGTPGGGKPVPWVGNSNPVPTKSYVDPGRTPKATYTYAVVATYPDTAPYRAGSSQPASLAMLPGLPPAGLSATTSLGTTVTLSWQPVLDATGYQVFRNGSPITPQPVRGISYVDTGLQPGLYTYSVASFFSTESAGEIPGELSPLQSIQVVLSRCARP
ncbi:MAG: fibronectin type III domain-containing protein [Gemmatimonadales bacterium]